MNKNIQRLFTVNKRASDYVLDSKEPFPTALSELSEAVTTTNEIVCDFRKIWTQLLEWANCVGELDYNLSISCEILVKIEVYIFLRFHT